MRDEAVMGDLADLDVAGLGRAFRSGDASPVEAAEAALARIERYDEKVNAFVFLDRAATLEAARASEARYRNGAALSPLDGVPTSVKDLTPVRGWPNRRGSAALPADVPAPEDASSVARLREAGAVFIGKTATPESGSRIVTRSSVHGVTSNPYASDRTPGGSSGGAAAALALGMGTLATGTDGAGSIRIPAAFCNVTGLKPGFGRVPAFPPSHFMPHSVTGPMARSVADLAAMTDVMSRPDPRDPFTWPVPFDATAVQAGVVGLKIALSYDAGTGRAPEPRIVAALDRVADALAEAGAVMERVDPVWPVDPSDPFTVFWETSYTGFLDLYPPETAALMDPLLHDIAARGRRHDTSAYHRALNDRLAITSAAHGFLTQYDGLLCPSVIGPAFDLEREAPEGEASDDWSWCPYAYIFNMTGQPAVAVPAGFDGDGLPLGVQIAARSGGEETLLRLAGAAEAALGLTGHRPALLSEL